MNSSHLKKCMTQYLRSCIGATTKSAAVLSPKEEKKLWDTGVHSLATPVGLLRAVFFYDG